MLSSLLARPVHGSMFERLSTLALISFFLILSISPLSTADVVTPGYEPWSNLGGGNCKGSRLCSQIKQGYCIEAIGLYDNYTVYHKYTAFTSRGHTFFTGYGCTAMYKCNADSDFGPGMTGKELKEAFALIYSKSANGTHCGKCGSHTVQNPNCRVVLDQCQGCVDSNGGAGEPLSNICPPLPSPSATYFLNWNNSANATGGTSRLVELFGTNPPNLASTTVSLSELTSAPEVQSSLSANSATLPLGLSVASGPPIPAPGATLALTSSQPSASTTLPPATQMPVNTNGLTTSGTGFGIIGGLNNFQTAQVTVTYPSSVAVA
ncbi:MAG: hypothetical protein M1814_003021 [Vezdaea aestivalis]|nr:MAG: hypothetical protein M1814_003021 [Vezdaea aestivalis]